MTDAVVFLDIDGVLNAHEFDHEAASNRIDRDKVDRFNAILRVTGAKIVLSSAWRYHVIERRMTLDGFDWLLRSHGVVANRVIGFTREDTIIGFQDDGMPIPKPNERGEQISYWRFVNRHTGPYVVLDDIDIGITDAGHPWVAVDGECGLCAQDVAEAVSILLGKEVVAS